MKQQNNILIVHEDTKSPVYKYLVTKYPNLQYQSSSLDNDFHSMLNCKNLAISVGTFSLAAVKLSNTIKKIYIPSTYKVSSNYDIDWTGLDVEIVSI